MSCLGVQTFSSWISWLVEKNPDTEYIQKGQSCNTLICIEIYISDVNEAHTIRMIFLLKKKWLYLDCGWFFPSEKKSITLQTSINFNKVNKINQQKQHQTNQLPTKPTTYKKPTKTKPSPLER